MTAFSLTSRCPRLARARDQYIADQAERAARRRRLRARWTKLHSLAGHRELQLARAYATGDRRYIDRRANKLERVRAELAAVDAALEASA